LCICGGIEFIGSCPKMIGMVRVLKAVYDSILNLEVEDIASLVQKALDEGISVPQILDKMTEAMRTVGRKFENMEYFLADLLMAAEAFKQGFQILKPHLQTFRRSEPLATVVIGTVKGDIHDIGKNMVSTMLTVEGFQVMDLGVDIPAEKFVEETEKTGAEILALSALLSTSLKSIEEVIGLLEEKNLKGKVKVILGGTAVTRDFARQVHAAYAEDAVQAVEMCKKLAGKVFLQPKT